MEIEVEQALLLDLRYLPARLDFGRRRMPIPKTDTSMRCEDFWDQVKVDQTYLEYVRLHVRQALDATEVFAMPDIVEILSTTDNRTVHSTHVALSNNWGRYAMFQRSAGKFNYDSILIWQMLVCLYAASSIQTPL